MSFYKDLYTNVGENNVKRNSKPTKAQKRLSDAMDASKQITVPRHCLRKPQQHVELMSRKALNNPRYRKLIERAKDSKKPGALLLASLISIHGSIEKIPPSKLKSELLRKLNKTQGDNIERRDTNQDLQPTRESTTEQNPDRNNARSNQQYPSTRENAAEANSAGSKGDNENANLD